MPLMTQSEYARHRGITKQAVSKLVKESRIVLTEDRKVDSEVSDILLDVAPRTKKGSCSSGKKAPKKKKEVPKIDLDPEKCKVKRSNLSRSKISTQEKLSEVLDYSKARAELTKAKAELAKLTLAEEKGELVRVSDVERQAFDCGRRARDKILSVVDRVAGLLAAEMDEAKVREILDKELRRALAELAGG